MIIDKTGWVTTDHGVFEIKAFSHLQPIELMLTYHSKDLLTEAEMRADVENFKSEILAKIRAYISVPDNILDRMEYSTHLIDSYFQRHSRNLRGQFAGVYGVLYNLKCEN